MLDDPTLKLWRCPWCGRQALALHRAGDPWLVEVGDDLRIITDQPWYSCGLCRQDGTLAALRAILTDSTTAAAVALLDAHAKAHDRRRPRSRC